MFKLSKSKIQVPKNAKPLFQIKAVESVKEEPNRPHSHRVMQMEFTKEHIPKHTLFSQPVERSKKI